MGSDRAPSTKHYEAQPVSPATAKCLNAELVIRVKLLGSPPFMFGKAAVSTTRSQ